MSILTPTMLASENPLSHIVQHELFRYRVGSHEFVFSDHMLMLLLAAVLLMIILPLVARDRARVPKGLKNFFESICVFIREEVARPVLGRDTDRYIPFLWTTFFFILFCNLIGMIPLNSIFYLLSHGRYENLGGIPTANIWVTGSMAAVAFVMIHLSGIHQQGFFSYFKNFIPTVPWPLIPVMYILEFIGALVKPFALAIRLFANIVAGHTVLASLLAMVFVFKSYLISGVVVLGCSFLDLLELFVCFLQAYIFTFLTTLFIGMAVHPEH